MAKRLPERDQAFEMYRKSNGKMSTGEIAKNLGLNAGTVRNWKYKDKWDEKRKKRRRGGQFGNQNSKGHGAPAGNTNAETHGAYSMPRSDRLTPEQIQEIQDITAEFEPTAVIQLRRLLAKQADLERRIQALDQEAGDLYLDRIMTMELPDGGEMKYRSESSAFSRQMVLEAELNRVHGRIIKLLDSLRGLESERKRLELERQRLEFNRQKALGIFNVPDVEKDSMVKTREITIDDIEVIE